MRREPVFKSYDYALYKKICCEKEHDKILLQQEEIFQMTQPKGLDPAKEKISGGSESNAFETYIMEKDRLKIDERREEAHHNLEIWREELEKREEELRKSKDLRDRIYTMWFLDRKKVWQIARAINYSKQHTYRMLEDIRLCLRVR